MEERTTGQRLDAETAGEILRRAAELDADRHEHVPGVDRIALEAAAEEVGLSPAAVRRALAEHDAGALVRPPDRSILGPARALAVRTVDLPVSVARPRVERWLKGQMLEVQERRGDEVVWCRRGDLAAKVRRKVDPTKRIRLDGVDAVIASVVGAGDGRALIRLEADLEHTRRGLIGGVAAVPAASGPVLGGVVAAITGEPLFLAGGVPVGAALGGLGLYAGRRTLATERAEAARVLELFLDDLDRGA
jgi:hypothetical protein